VVAQCWPSVCNSDPQHHKKRLIPLALAVLQPGWCSTEMQSSIGLGTGVGGSVENWFQELPHIPKLQMLQSLMDNGVIFAYNLCTSSCIL
jgi:hypothetical protein